MNPNRLPWQYAMEAAQKDPLKTFVGPDAWQTQLKEAGGNEELARRLALAKGIKAGTLELRAGGEAGIPMPDGTIKWIKVPSLLPGEDYQRDAQGNIISAGLLPGHAAAAEAAAGAAEQGKVTHQINTLPTTGGGNMPVYGVPASIPGSPNAPAPHAVAPPPGAAPGAAPYQPKLPAVAPPSPAAPPNAREPTPPGVTPGIWSKVPTRPNTTGFGVDPYVEHKVGKMADKDAELSDKYGSEADLADQRIAFNNEALKVLGGSNTGPLSEQINHLAAKAHELGINAPWIPDEATVNNSAELKKFLLRNPLLSLKPTFGGRPAASEFQVLANDASPSPQMLSGAISRLVQLDTQAAGFSKQRATDYGYYHDHLHGDPQRFESYYANRVPFAKWLNDNPNGRAGEAHVEAGASKDEKTAVVDGVTYAKRNGQWVKQ
jgi:hypothetical protein